jgi:hypothetical protein
MDFVLFFDVFSGGSSMRFGCYEIFQIEKEK